MNTRQKHTKRWIQTRIDYWKKQLNESFGSVPQNPDDWKADDGFIRGDEYEEQQRYRMEVPEDAGEFLQKNRAKIQRLSSYLKGDMKRDFDLIVSFIKGQAGELAESSSYDEVNYQSLWSAFKSFYNDKLGAHVLFEVNGEIKKVLGFQKNTADGLKVNLASKDPSKYPGINAEDFVNELSSYGMKASKIERIEADADGETYALVGYRIENFGKWGSVFFFEFGDGASKANDFLS